MVLDMNIREVVQNTIVELRSELEKCELIMKVLNNQVDITTGIKIRSEEDDFKEIEELLDEEEDTGFIEDDKNFSWQPEEN